MHEYVDELVEQNCHNYIGLILVQLILLFLEKPHKFIEE